MDRLRWVDSPSMLPTSSVLAVGCTRMDRAMGTAPNDFIGHGDQLDRTLRRPHESGPHRSSADRGHRNSPDLVKARLETQWPTWERRFDEAMDLVNSALGKRQRSLFQRSSCSPRWESCLGFPSDDIVDDGYYAIHWAAIGWSGAGCRSGSLSCWAAETNWLRTALQHAFDQDYIFVEWRKVDWRRLTLPKATPETIAHSIVCLVEGDARRFGPR
jgi:hypothetical protein